MDIERDSEIEKNIFRLLGVRGEHSSICPSDVARAMYSVESEWRAAMPRIREVAGDLASRGLLRVTRKGKAVAATSEGGPIRLARPV